MSAQDRAQHVLDVPTGGGLQMRITHEPSSNTLTVELLRGRWPEGKQVAFFIVLPRAIENVRLREPPTGGIKFWLNWACIEVSPIAAKRIAKWLAARGIGQPATATPETAASDALDRLDLNTDTPAPVAPGGTA